MGKKPNTIQMNDKTKSSFLIPFLLLDFCSKLNRYCKKWEVKVKFPLMSPKMEESKKIKWSATWDLALKKFKILKTLKLK